MKYTTVKISEILQHPTKRMDAQYWLARVNNLKLKKKKKIKKAPSHKLQAASLTASPRDDRIHLERIYYGICNKRTRKNRGRSRRDPATSKERHGT
jgi:hypothetical protein